MFLDERADLTKPTAATYDTRLLPESKIQRIVGILTWDW